MPDEHTQTLSPHAIALVLRAIVGENHGPGYFEVLALSAARPEHRWYGINHQASLEGFIEKFYDRDLFFNIVSFTEEKARLRYANPLAWEWRQYRNAKFDQRAEWIYAEDDHHPLWRLARVRRPARPAKLDPNNQFLPVPRALCRVPYELDASKRGKPDLNDVWRRYPGLEPKLRFDLKSAPPGARSDILYKLTCRMMEEGLVRDEARVILEASAAYKDRGERDNLDRLISKARGEHLRGVYG